MSERDQFYETQTVENYQILRKEQRLYFIPLVEVAEKSNEDLIKLVGPTYYFCGFKLDRSSHTSDTLTNSAMNFSPRYMGILIFFRGHTYVGELNNRLQPDGDGMYFFSSGTCLRGSFRENHLNDHCMFTLPNDVCVFGKFSQGIISSNMTRIDVLTGTYKVIKSSQGKMKKSFKDGILTESMARNFQDLLRPTNIIPERLTELQHDKLYFGTVLIDSLILHYGFIQDQRPTQWGVRLTISPPVSIEDPFSFGKLSWLVTDFSSENQTGGTRAPKILNLKQSKMYFGSGEVNSFVEEIGVFSPIENKFELAEASTLTPLPNSVREAIDQGFVEGLFHEHFPSRSADQNKNKIVPYVFFLNFFNDCFHFFVYGILTEKCRMTYPDTLEIFLPSFYSHQANEVSLATENLAQRTKTGFSGERESSGIDAGSSRGVEDHGAGEESPGHDETLNDMTLTDNVNQIKDISELMKDVKQKWEENARAMFHNQNQENTGLLNTDLIRIDGEEKHEHPATVEFSSNGLSRQEDHNSPLQTDFLKQTPMSPINANRKPEKLKSLSIDKGIKELSIELIDSRPNPISPRKSPGARRQYTQDSRDNSALTLNRTMPTLELKPQTYLCKKLEREEKDLYSHYLRELKGLSRSQVEENFRNIARIIIGASASKANGSKQSFF